MNDDTRYQPSDGSNPEMRSRVIDRSPINYGWIILFSGTVGLMMTAPGQTFGFSVFLDSIINDLELSRSVVSTLYSVATVLGSLALPFIGKFIDRRGPRTAVVSISLAFAAGCVWMGFSVGLVSLFFGFLLIRALGQGALALVSLNVINIWFVRRRGMAVGVSGLGVAVAMAFFPQLIELLISIFDWRSAYMLMGLAVALTMLPVGFLLFRDRPEKFGLLPDGDLPRDDLIQVAEVNYTLMASRRTLTFWLFAVGGMFVAALGTGLIFHHYSIMQLNGLGRSQAGAMFISFGFVMAGANLATGLLLDRVPPRFLLSGALLLLGTALFYAPYVASADSVLIYGTILGLMQGMQTALQSAVYAYYFGRQHFGAIKGFAKTLMIAGTAAGPVLFALGYDLFGSYQAIFAIAAVPTLLVAMITPFLRLKRTGRIL